ncbi:unnamed protein product [Eruca vesicaria subsp. sativa]|uniref:UBC core domain-containing protein n=1 Tax=Eruca vesicaria subsp. sativa TaxID=29727 RepID=A0ABC8KEB1_ERUVS|nr:unnamed protein product [Eruca vesicaria subsp. sativa]
MTNDIDVMRIKSDDDDLASKSRLLLAGQVRSNSTDRCRSNSLDRFMRRAEKVWAVSTIEKIEDGSQKCILESNQGPEEEEEKVGDLVQLGQNQGPEEEEEEKVGDMVQLGQNQGPEEEEEKVGDMVQLGQNNYFIVDIFEKEIMELGDKVDLNFKTFNNFEAVDGGAPVDHHFYNYKCCYSSCFCFCKKVNVEREWGILKRQLALWEKSSEDGSKEVSFCVRTYSERKELMRVAATVTNGDQSHSLLFFDIKFPKEYPNQAPSFFYHSYGLPLSNLRKQKRLRAKLLYNIFDVFLHIEEIVMMNTNKSCRHMLDMLKRPLMGFEDFVKGHFRKKGALILRNMMNEMDLNKERDKNIFLKTYIAFEDNKAYCEHLLNSDLKKELKRFKEKESSSLNENYYPSSSRKTSRHQNYSSKFSVF